jgi:hypothetical protein
LNGLRLPGDQRALSLKKWIDDPAIAEPPAVLKILAVERFAARFDRRGEDQVNCDFV